MLLRKAFLSISAHSWKCLSMLRPQNGSALRRSPIRVSQIHWTSSAKTKTPTPMSSIAFIRWSKSAPLCDSQMLSLEWLGRVPLARRVTCFLGPGQSTVKWIHFRTNWFNSDTKINQFHGRLINTPDKNESISEQDQFIYENVLNHVQIVRLFLILFSNILFVLLK